LRGADYKTNWGQRTISLKDFFVIELSWL